MQHLFIFLFILYSTHLHSDDNCYSITAPTLFTPDKEGETTTITAIDIDSSQHIFIQDILRDAPSLHMSNAGDNGRQTRFAMRGALNGENLVLIDGIPVNDPAASSGIFDFANLLVDDIDEIKILPGTNTVQYGADAMGGVIHLATKSGQGPLQIGTSIEAGNYHTSRGNFWLGGEKGPLALHGILSGYRSSTGTFLNKIHNNRQADDYRNLLGSFKVGCALSPDHELVFSRRESRSRLIFDKVENINGLFLPFASDHLQKNHHQLTSITYQGACYDGLWEPSLILSHTNSERYVPPLAFASSGEVIRLHHKSDFNWCPKHVSHIGYEATETNVKDSFSGKHRRTHQALFAQHLYKPLENTELILGSRLDFYEDVGTHTTYRLATNHTINRTRLRASYGTGFKAPLLSDMFNISRSAIPNPDLKPETNHSFDIGFDQLFLDNKTEFNLTYFENHIDHVFLTELMTLLRFQRINGEKRKARGVEAKAKTPFSDKLLFTTHATYTHARDSKHKKRTRTPHLPYWQWHNNFTYTISETLSCLFDTHLVTHQIDALNKTKLPGYTLLDLKGNYKTKYADFYARIENITDKRYEQTFGYGVRGRCFYLGMRMKT